MPILDLQRRLAEVGRIRLGQQVESRSGKKHPAALDTFRLTSRDRSRIDEAAKLYGGTVTKWESPTGVAEWEVITQADRLPVVVPPSAMAFSQDYELWSAGGCQRRCDGLRERIGEQPCLCDPENRQCEIHTRLSVMLRDLKWGVWRVDTTGYYAALEIGGSVEVIKLAVGSGHMISATLRLDQRTIKRPDEGTKRFVVPVLDPEGTPGQMLGVAAGQPQQPPQAAVAPQAALSPAPKARPASIAEQVAASEQLPSRRRATPIKATGITPRTAAQRGQPANIPPPDEPDDDGIQPDTVCPNCTEGPVEATRTGWRCRRCGMTDIEAYDKGLGGWHVKDDTRHGRHEQTEEEAYDAIERAREAAEATQDPPRMVTHGQLTALGTILGKRGYNDRSPDGVRARLDYCMNLVRQLMPDNPWANRAIESSKQLTFDEASTLISYFKKEQPPEPPAPQPDTADPTPEPQPDPGCEQNPPSSQQPVDERDQLTMNLT